MMSDKKAVYSGESVIIAKLRKLHSDGSYSEAYERVFKEFGVADLTSENRDLLEPHIAPIREECTENEIAYGKLVTEVSHRGEAFAEALTGKKISWVPSFVFGDQSSDLHHFCNEHLDGIYHAEDVAAYAKSLPEETQEKFLTLVSRKK